VLPTQESRHWVGLLGLLFNEKKAHCNSSGLLLLFCRLFLSQDKLSSSKFAMTWNGLEEECYFFTKRDKTINER